MNKLQTKPWNIPGPSLHIDEARQIGYATEGRPSWVKWRHFKKLEQKLDRGIPVAQLGPRERELYNVMLRDSLPGLDGYYI